MASMRTDMVAGTIQMGSKRYVVIEEGEYERLRRRASVIGDIALPELPAPSPSGNLPAVKALRSGLAQKLIKRRWAAGLTQAELARRARVRPETLNRIEKAKVTPDTATVVKITRALERAERDAERTR